MLIYLIDTSGPSAGVALMEDGKIVYEAVVQNKRTHSESIMPMTEEALLRAGRTAGDIDYFAAVVGPGSFTGVRIGVTAVKAMAHAAGKPCLAVNALEALARGQRAFDGAVAPIQDARAGQVYRAAFANGERLLPDAPEKLEDFLTVVRERAAGRGILFVGDGVPPHRERIAAFLGEQARFAPPEALYLRPACAVALAAEHLEQATDYRALKPYYLRPPQAVRQKNLVEKAHER
ncbi:MAG: tRNA (adenosine(37)-N6)-threonylcarbamoyltransferase complex dimerization subunit type 1 TsaB [Clostridia bacterium]|nr:tRNA (adenosine(37)-N6)-threonylcarbamoyltransferase complex dimerization subunit type 1 TsaB [Clostridia bacterium]